MRVLTLPALEVNPTISPQRISNSEPCGIITPAIDAKTGRQAFKGTGKTLGGLAQVMLRHQ